MLENLYTKILVTGGGGFIGSSYIYQILSRYENIQIINVDKKTYAASQSTLNMFQTHKNYEFLELDICNAKDIESVIYEEKPDLIIHFAAESHVDNSIVNPNAFIDTNIQGTANLLNGVKNAKKRSRVQEGVQEGPWGAQGSILQRFREPFCSMLVYIC